MVNRMQPNRAAQIWTRKIAGASPCSQGHPALMGVWMGGSGCSLMALSPFFPLSTHRSTLPLPSNASRPPSAQSCASRAKPAHGWWAVWHKCTNAAACINPATRSAAQKNLMAHLQQCWSGAKVLHQHNTRVGLRPYLHSQPLKWTLMQLTFTLFGRWLQWD